MKRREPEKRRREPGVLELSINIDIFARSGEEAVMN